MPKPPLLPDQFDQDPRVHVDKSTGKFQYEDEDTGQEYEWTGQAWVPLLDDTLIRSQQAAYSVKGVDENTPAKPVLIREERKNKRKQGEKDARERRPSKSAPSSAPKRTAVWVTNLPPNTTPELLSTVFSKAGVLLVDDDGHPRIKMYFDDAGKFKGEALIMYFKEGSVSLAITLLDDTELELGAGYGNMRVRVAEYDKSRSKEDQSTEEPQKKKLSHEDKQRMSKRMRTLESKLAWHSDSDSDDARRGQESASATKLNRVVVLKGMFEPEDLQTEPELLLELKDDVREEAESLGEVTSVVLYDQEPDGVMTVKFKDATAAQACVMRMNGRYFDKRKISATIYSGKERFRKSGPEDFLTEDAEEQERLGRFADWLANSNE